MRFLPHVAVVCLLLTLSGCGDLSDVWGNPQDRAKKGLADSDIASFEIGSASKWAEPGLYLDYANSHGVALKSEHGMLVALLLVGPETGAKVRYDRLANLFRDTQSDETFTTDGVKWGGDEDRPSLARCRIRHLGPVDDPEVELIVDPGKLFRQEDRQWSKAASNHLFVDGQE